MFIYYNYMKLKFILLFGIIVVITIFLFLIYKSSYNYCSSIPFEEYFLCKNDCSNNNSVFNETFYSDCFEFCDITYNVEISATRAYYSCCNSKNFISRFFCFRSTSKIG
jgi:hypothetical protein